MNTVQNTKTTRTNRYACSGAYEGETLASAVRRQVAWIALAQKQRNEGHDEERADGEIEEATGYLLAISLEIEELEHELASAQADLAKAREQ